MSFVIAGAPLITWSSRAPVIPEESPHVPLEDVSNETLDQSQVKGHPKTMLKKDRGRISKESRIRQLLSGILTWRNFQKKTPGKGFIGWPGRQGNIKEEYPKKMLRNPAESSRILPNSWRIIANLPLSFSLFYLILLTKKKERKNERKGRLDEWKRTTLPTCRRRRRRRPSFLFIDKMRKKATAL